MTTPESIAIPRRLLIANHIDASLLHQNDQRAFVQRIFWLVQEGDVIVLPAAPDWDFVAHVCGLIGVRNDRLTILVAPPGRYGQYLFDPMTLTSVELVERLTCAGQSFDEVFSLWPSAEVAELATRLGVESAMPGARFFSQGGDDLANSKATFRAFAAASGTPIPNGRVCRAQEELAHAISTILASSEGVMVKQVHNGAAAGCTVICRDWESAPRTAGSKWVDDISEVDESVPSLWHWASVGGRFPVVVEQLEVGCRTIYFEFFAEDTGLTLLATGALEYEAGKMVREHVPLNWRFAQEALSKGADYAYRLAEHYRASGYRGYLSADGILNSEGLIKFTEMNARVGGSLPVYGGMWGRVVRRSDDVDRHVVQHLTPTTWQNLSTSKVLEGIESAGLIYDPEARTGAMLGIPPHKEIANGRYLLCLITRTAPEQAEMMKLLNAAFR